MLNKNPFNKGGPGDIKGYGGWRGSQHFDDREGLEFQRWGFRF